jgi:hypothetical protein
MTTLSEANFTKELEGLGFRGKVLQDLRVLITTKEEIEELESYIINEDSHTSTLSIYNGYRRLRMALSPVTKVEFISWYQTSSPIEEKVLCLQNLLKCYIDERWVEQLDMKLHRGAFTLSYFYTAFNDNKSLHIKKLIVEAEILSNGDEIEWGSDF